MLCNQGGLLGTAKFELVRKSRKRTSRGLVIQNPRAAENRLDYYLSNLVSRASFAIPIPAFNRLAADNLSFTALTERVEPAATSRAKWSH